MYYGVSGPQISKLGSAVSWVPKMICDSVDE